MSLNSSPVLLLKLIEKFLEESGLSGTYTQCYAMKIWKEIVGEAISKMTIIEKVHDGILYIHVKNSSWRQELQYRKKDILLKMNKTLPSPIIRDIIFK